MNTLKYAIFFGAATGRPEEQRLVQLGNYTNWAMSGFMELAMLESARNMAPPKLLQFSELRNKNDETTS